jgi:transposase
MLLIGIDQSKDKHDVCFMDESGRQLARFQVPHEAGGFQRLHDERERLQVTPGDCFVALESAYSLLVDYLLDQNYHVHVIPGKAVDRHRDRHRQSRSVSDQSDAFVLADAMRTDRHLYPAWYPDQPLTRQIASQVRLLRDLKRSILRFCNRLRALLHRYYPMAAELFSDLDTQIASHFIMAYPTPRLAQQLTLSRFTVFCRDRNYTRSDLITRRYSQILGARTFASPDVAEAYASQAQGFARVIGFLVKEYHKVEKQLAQSFQQHPDQRIFASLPGAGKLLAPALLSKFGDCRARFPTAGVAQAIAGTCPVTIKSGKRRRVEFRRACDKEFRYYATQFARCSVSKSPWAAAYFHSVSPRCDKASQAYRRLANRWLAIIWRLWTDQIEYDEAVHLRNRHTGHQPR